MAKHRKKIEVGQGPIAAIYHVVWEHEGFEQAAQALFGLVRESIEKYLGRPRALYLDIEGHRNEAGGFDGDMLELQTHFLLQVLLPCLTEATTPLGRYTNPKGQSDDLPEALDIQPEPANGEVRPG